MNIPFPTDIKDFVIWLGSSVAGGVILSLLLERIPAFKNWKSPFKGYSVMALFVALPLVATWAGGLVAKVNPDILAAVQHYLGLALSGLTAWAASQYAHFNDDAHLDTHFDNLVADEPK